jgi:hypothetical protein
MSDKKLESFKIGDKQKPRVKAATSAATKAVEPVPETQTLGFARIEGILDKETPQEVGKSLARLLDQLTELDSHSKTPKAKSAAKKARAAVERTIDLLDYLFRTKAAMEAGDGQQEAVGTKK